MATDAENLATIRSRLLASLATEASNPKPSYTVGNQSTDYNGWRTSIMQQLTQINELIAVADPYEVEVRGIP